MFALCAFPGQPSARVIRYHRVVPLTVVLGGAGEGDVCARGRDGFPVFPPVLCVAGSPSREFRRPPVGSKQLSVPVGDVLRQSTLKFIAKAPYRYPMRES